MQEEVDSLKESIDTGTTEAFKTTWVLATRRTQWKALILTLHEGHATPQTLGRVKYMLSSFRDGLDFNHNVYHMVQTASLNPEREMLKLVVNNVNGSIVNVLTSVMREIAYEETIQEPFRVAFSNLADLLQDRIPSLDETQKDKVKRDLVISILQSLLVQEFTDEGVLLSILDITLNTFALLMEPNDVSSTLISNAISFAVTRSRSPYRLKMIQRILNQNPYNSIYRTRRSETPLILPEDLKEDDDEQVFVALRAFDEPENYFLDVLHLAARNTFNDATSVLKYFLSRVEMDLQPEYYRFAYRLYETAIQNTEETARRAAIQLIADTFKEPIEVKKAFWGLKREGLYEAMKLLATHPATRGRLQLYFDRAEIDVQASPPKDDESITYLDMRERNVREEVSRLLKDFPEPEFKPCPNCQTPIERIAACYHIECPTCHYHFSFLCGFGARTSAPIYVHLKQVHGGIYPISMNHDAYGDLEVNKWEGGWTHLTHLPSMNAIQDNVAEETNGGCGAAAEPTYDSVLPLSDRKPNDQAEEKTAEFDVACDAEYQVFHRKKDVRTCPNGHHVCLYLLCGADRKRATPVRVGKRLHVRCPVCRTAFPSSAFTPSDCWPSDSKLNPVTTMVVTTSQRPERESRQPHCCVQ